MSTITSQLGTVSFQGHDLTVITTASGEHLVAMKPICEAIGEPPREFRRLSDLSHAARADSSSCR